MGFARAVPSAEAPALRRRPLRPVVFVSDPRARERDSILMRPSVRTAAAPGGAAAVDVYGSSTTLQMCWTGEVQAALQ